MTFQPLYNKYVKPSIILFSRSTSKHMPSGPTAWHNVGAISTHNQQPISPTSKDIWQEAASSQSGLSSCWSATPSGLVYMQQADGMNSDEQGRAAAAARASNSLSLVISHSSQVFELTCQPWAMQQCFICLAVQNQRTTYCQYQLHRHSTHKWSCAVHCLSVTVWHYLMWS